MRTIKLTTEKSTPFTVTIPQSASKKIIDVAAILSDIFDGEITKSVLARELLLDAIANTAVDINGQAYTLDEILNKEFDKSSDTINVPVIESNNQNVEISNSNPE